MVFHAHCPCQFVADGQEHDEEEWDCAEVLVFEPRFGNNVPEVASAHCQHLYALLENHIVLPSIYNATLVNMRVKGELICE